MDAAQTCPQRDQVDVHFSSAVLQAQILYYLYDVSIWLQPAIELGQSVVLVPKRIQAKAE